MNDDLSRSSPPPPDDRGRRRVALLASHFVLSSKTSRRNKEEDKEEEEIQSAEEWISSPGKVFSNRKKRYVITRESIEQFGKVTRDEQWIHKSNDDDDLGETSSSSSSVLGGVKLPIAHGFLTVSLLTFLSSAPRKSTTWCKYEINCGMRNVKFVKPVEVNSVLGCRTKVKSVSWKRGREMLETTYECEMFKEGGGRGEEEIVLEAEWIVRQVLA